ncbi:MAG: PD-(D/E)XK nuclease family protein, partial [Phascolarctobacterium sp.]
KDDNYNELVKEDKQDDTKKQAADFREQIAANLWRESGQYQKMSTDSVFLNVFKSRDEEMRWVLSKIKELLRGKASEAGEIQNGVAPSDIIVAVRKLNNYTGLRQIADEYGIPVSLPKTMALASHPVAEFVQLLLAAAVPNKKGADAYFAVLNCPWSKLFTQCETDGISSLREKKLYTLPAAVRQDLPENVAADGFVKIINEYIDAIGIKHTLREHYDLLQNVFTKLSVETSLGALYKEQKLALQSLQASILAKSSLLHCASALVDDYEACGHGESKYTAQAWQELMVEAMQSENIVLERGRQDGVKITEVINLQGLTRPYVFILGMREHEFPTIENNEWIYNDLDRLEMIQYGIELKVKAMQFSEDAWFFAAAAVAAQKELYLSWHEDSEAGKSPYIEGIMQLFDGLQLKKGEDKIPASLDEFERKGLLCDKAWLEGKLQSAAVLTTAVKSDVVRNDKDADAYNGVLTEQKVVQQAKNAAGKRFSASTLEKYAACPFQFLGERIWSKKEVTEQEEEVAATSKGTLLHNTLAAFVKTYLQKKISQNDLGMLELRLNAIFEEECQKLVGDKIVDNELWKLEKQRILQTLRRWLRFECAEQEAWQSYTPQAVEW